MRYRTGVEQPSRHLAAAGRLNDGSQGREFCARHGNAGWVLRRTQGLADHHGAVTEATRSGTPEAVVVANVLTGACHA